MVDKFQPSLVAKKIVIKFENNNNHKDESASKFRLGEIIDITSIDQHELKSKLKCLFA